MSDDRRHPGRSPVAPTPAAEDPIPRDVRAGSQIGDASGRRPSANRADDRPDEADVEPTGNGPPIERSDGQVYGG